MCIRDRIATMLRDSKQEIRNITKEIKKEQAEEESDLRNEI